MAKVAIFGAGDIARLAHFYFSRYSEHEVCGFVVDDEYLTVDSLAGLPVVGLSRLKESFPPSEYRMFVAISYIQMNRVRAEKYHLMKKLGYDLLSYVSSRCTYLSDSPVGDNCFILEDNTIQPFVKIGSNVTIWSGNHIGHDSIIDDHCFLASHIVVSGRVHIKPYCFLGVNATLRNGITIAPASLIGAGALIMRDTEEKGVYVSRQTEILSRNSDKVEI